jgi:hypothetical protein
MEKIGDERMRKHTRYGILPAYYSPVETIMMMSNLTTVLET